MTILLYTDASTKNGYSCYAHRSSDNEKVFVGILHTTNTALAETVAIIKGLERLIDGQEVLVISDFRGVVTNILNYRQGVIQPHLPNTYRSYKKGRLKLFAQLDRLDVDAVWVPSKFPNERHLEVDNMSKVILQEYLQSKCKVG